MMMMPKLQIRA